MSVKHVKDYYTQICDQYTEMLENLRDAEKDLSNEDVTPEYVENLKKMIAPIKDNFERWSYMMFLLNKPQKKEKQPQYEKRMQKALSKLNPNNSVESTVQAGKNAVNNLKKK